LRGGESERGDENPSAWRHSSVLGVMAGRVCVQPQLPRSLGLEKRIGCASVISPERESQG